MLLLAAIICIIVGLTIWSAIDAPDHRWIDHRRDQHGGLG